MTVALTLSSVFARQTRGVVATLTLSLVAAAAGIALLGVSGWFLTGAALTTAALSFNLFGPSALVRGLSFVRIGSRYGEKLVGHDLTLKLLADIREWLFRRLIPRVPLYGVGLRHGDLVSRLVADVEALDTLFITAIGPALTVLTVGLGLGAVLAFMVPAAATMFGIGFATAALVIPLLLVLATRTAGRDLVSSRARLRTAVLDGIEGHADLILFARTEDAQAGVAAAAEAISRLNHRQNRLGAGAAAAVLVVACGTALGVFVLGLEAVQATRISGPILVGLVLAVLASFEGASVVVRNAGRFAVALGATERLKALASAPPAVCEPLAPRRLPLGGDITFAGVQFAYRSEQPLFDDLTLHCSAGSRTAIVGESGCGKSTLLDLALRLIDPDEGQIKVAGVDIAEVAQADLHARVALMSQSTPVFLGSIRDNLRLAAPHAKDAMLWAVLKQARLDAFVESLPDGLETWCGEGGRTLSAGQARRLCLARTLLTSAAILLLDEPTSGLDRNTERMFLADLRTATAGRTVLLVTHAVLPRGTVDRVLTISEGGLQELHRDDYADQPASASESLPF